MAIENEIFCDVAIIGGGPAGCSAGIRLAERGSNVIIIDKKKFPRDKICGGLITQKAMDLLRDELRINDLSSVIESESNSFGLYERNQLINKASTNEYTYCVTRNNFDYFLVKKASSIGCNVLDGIIVKNIHNSDKYLVAGNNKINYKYLIAADGVNSKAGMIINETLDKDLLAIGLQIEIPLSRIVNTGDWSYPKIYFGYVQYGWGWVFPKKDHVTVGLAGLMTDGLELRKRFKRLTGEIKCVQSIDDLPINGGIIPYGTFIKMPAKDGVFLTGDAAGFAEPITGEGIYYALKSGLLAAEVILSNSRNKENQYCILCNKYIINDLKQAKIARKFLFNQPFHSIAMKKLRKSTKHMVSFMRILSGEIDYKTFFCEIIKRKLGLK